MKMQYLIHATINLKQLENRKHLFRIKASHEKIIRRVIFFKKTGNLYRKQGTRSYLVSEIAVSRKLAAKSGYDGIMGVDDLFPQ